MLSTRFVLITSCFLIVVCVSPRICSAEINFTIDEPKDGEHIDHNSDIGCSGSSNQLDVPIVIQAHMGGVIVQSVDTRTSPTTGDWSATLPKPGDGWPLGEMIIRVRFEGTTEAYNLVEIVDLDGPA